MAKHAVVVDVSFALLPFSSTRFEDPQTHHVLEKSNCTKGATFVREVVALDLPGDQHRLAFDADQRPGAGGNIGKTVLQRRAHDSASRIVSSGSDNSCPL